VHDERVVARLDERLEQRQRVVRATHVQGLRRQPENSA
jgi:hypothetical protein